MSLLAHALSLRAGKPYETLLKGRVLLPLDMRQTAVTPTPEMRRRLAVGYDSFGEPQPYFDAPAFASSGRLKSTANDMLDYAAANLAPDKTGIYAALRDTRRPHRPIEGSDEFMGLGLGVDAKGVGVGLTGGTIGFGCFFYVDLKDRRAIIVMTNIAVRNAADAQAVGLHLLDPEKFRRKKPSVGPAVAATYRASGVKAAIKRYRELQQTGRDRWSFAESELNDVGYWLLRRKANDDAIAVFRLNVETYPGSPNPHDSLGDAYLAAGRLEEAVESYRKAVALAEASNHPSVANYRASLEAALKQLGQKK